MEALFLHVWDDRVLQLASQHRAPRECPCLRMHVYVHMYQRMQVQGGMLFDPRQHLANACALQGIRGTDHLWFIL